MRKPRRKLSSRLRRGYLKEDGSVQYTGVPIQWIRACPNQIRHGAHYRKNGTCRCGDPYHSKMSEWGFRWNVDKKEWEPNETT